MTTSDLIAAIGVAFAGGSLVGGWVGALLARSTARKAAEPVIRVEWDAAGEIGALQFTNRIAEDLFIDRIDFDGEIWTGIGRYMPNGQPIKEDRVFQASPVVPRAWRIDASSTTRYPFSIRPNLAAHSWTAGVLEMDGSEFRITVSSSHATLRHRRIKVIARRFV